MAGTDMAPRKLVARCEGQEGARQDMDARPLTRAGREVRAGGLDGIGLHMQDALVSMELLAREHIFREGGCVGLHGDHEGHWIVNAHCAAEVGFACCAFQGATSPRCVRCGCWGFQFAVSVSKGCT